MTMGLKFGTSLLALGLSFSIFATSARAADTCGGMNYFGDLTHWTGERSAVCGTYSRVKNVSITGNHGSADWDAVEMGIQCCDLDGVSKVVDYCEDGIDVVSQATGMTAWGAYGATYFNEACKAQAGGYVAGIHLFQTSLHGSYNGDGDFQSKWMSMKCCYPVAPPAANCGGWTQVSPSDHWSDGSSNGTTMVNGCGPDGYIRALMMSQVGYGAGDKEDTGIYIQCCTALPSPSPYTTATPSSPTPAPSTTPPPPTPTPTPFISPTPTPVSCPSNSNLDPNNNQNCICSDTIADMVYFKMSNTCACPTGYEPTPSTSPVACMPMVPSAEYYKDSSALSNYYPVCGTNRVPMDGMTTVNVASSSVPVSTIRMTYPTSTSSSNIYDYATPSASATPMPLYLYDASLTKCACTTGLRTVAIAATLPSKLSATLPTGNPRFYPDTYDTISSQTSLNNIFYAPVATARDGSSNGRTGVTFSAGSSACGCPNINEKMTNIDAADTTEPVGAVCKPLMGVGVGLLVNYNQVAHASLVKSKEITNPSTSQIVQSITLPTAGGSFSNYNRRIWVCPPMTAMNSTGTACVANVAGNACDDGNGTFAPSPVATSITGLSAKGQFDNTINKKMACCMNEPNLSVPGASVKFDCVETPAAQTKDFNTLWSTGDSAADGGQGNAIVLTNAQGQVISGYYTADGHHCDQFSEFAGQVTKSRVNPLVTAGFQMNTVTNSQVTGGSGSSALPVAITGATPFPVNSSAYNVMKGIVTGTQGGWLKTKPTSAADARSCPILLRAAMVVVCPNPTSDLSTTRTVVPPQSAERRCSVGATVNIHVRIEQIFEIAGQAAMKPYDTVLNGNPATINVSDILTLKYGSP
jgi:hypothetical protein